MNNTRFRAWQDNQMLIQPLSGVYGTARFLGLLYEDTQLMMYTGVKDRNNIEICEGDILLSKPLREACGLRPDERRARCEVKFGLGFYLEKPVWNLLSGEHEIIGNIYEN